MWPHSAIGTASAFTRLRIRLRLGVQPQTPTASGSDQQLWEDCRGFSSPLGPLYQITCRSIHWSDPFARPAHGRDIGSAPHAKAHSFERLDPAAAARKGNGNSSDPAYSSQGPLRCRQHQRKHRAYGLKPQISCDPRTCPQRHDPIDSIMVCPHHRLHS